MFPKISLQLVGKKFFFVFLKFKSLRDISFWTILKCEKSKIKNTFTKKKHETGTFFLVPFFQLLRSSITNFLLLENFYLHLAYSFLRISRFLTFYSNKKLYTNIFQ